MTKWSKLDTSWEGVSIDTLLEDIEHDATHALALCDGGYTTNMPLEDLVDGKAWIAFAYDGQPLEPQHLEFAVSASLAIYLLTQLAEFPNRLLWCTSPQASGD